MFDQLFFASKLGVAALISIAAMVAFNVYALAQVSPLTHGLLVVGSPMVELA